MPRSASNSLRPTSRAQSAPLIEVGKFSSGQPGIALPQGWKPLTFKKIPRHTEYVLVRDGEQVVVNGPAGLKDGQRVEKKG